MPQINQLSAYDSPQAGDQLPVFSTGNGDARKMSLSALLNWIANNFTTVKATSYVRVLPVTVANLPSASAAGAGASAFVSDATSTTFHAAPVGGGSQFVPVYSDGTIWRIG